MVARTACVAMGVLLLGATAAAAAPAATPAQRDALARRADALLDAGRFADALPLYDELVAFSEHPLPRLHLAWCLIELDLRHREAAALLAEVQGDGRLGVAAERVPRLRARLAELRRPGRIRVEVDGAQAGAARVVLNGWPVGGAPYDVLAARGTYSVRVDGPGCEERVALVAVETDAVIPLRFRCEGPSDPLAAAADDDDAPDTALASAAPPDDEAVGNRVAWREDRGVPSAAGAAATAPESEVASASAPATPPAPLLVAEDEPDGTARAWTALGVGAALTGVGAWFLVEAAVAEERPGAESRRMATIGGLAAGVGVGLVLTSYFLWPDAEPAEPAPGGPVAGPVPGGAVVGWAGGF